MKEIKESTYKGTRILLGNEKRDLINTMINYLISEGFEEIQIPNIQYRELFKNKVGIENTSMMFSVKDNSDRDLVLAPEYTAVVQNLAKTYFKPYKDVKLFYVQECYRGEKPQLGRFRQFTQIGVEILNPSKYWNKYILDLSTSLIQWDSEKYNLIINNERGLDYYKEFTFEIEHKESKLSICGGGEYEGGIGFAIGVDRILTLDK